MINYTFKSIFAPYFTSFVKMKAAMGFTISKIEYIFKELDEIYRIMPLHEPVLTKELVKAWRESRLNDSERTLYDKWSIISQFSRYMCHCGFVCYVPPMPRQKDKSFISRIFTHEEIERFFIAADSLRFHNIQPTLCLFSMPTLFRVLYATGIRIGEALNLMSTLKRVRYSSENRKTNGNVLFPLRLLWKLYYTSIYPTETGCLSRAYGTKNRHCSFHIQEEGY